jgi:hypothetical protein
MLTTRKFPSPCAFLAGVYSPRVPIRASGVVLVALTVSACDPSGAVMPAVPSGPDPAMLDAYDATVLASTESVAPTFAEVKQPRTESPRRFRAWLGWHQEACTPCTADDQAACTPCPAPKPYVCARPSRVIACDGDDIIARTVDGIDDMPDSPGVYVFEAKWSGGRDLVVTSITPIELPDAAKN